MSRRASVSARRRATMAAPAGDGQDFDAARRDRAGAADDRAAKEPGLRCALAKRAAAAPRAGSSRRRQPQVPEIPAAAPAPVIEEHGVEPPPIGRRQMKPPNRSRFSNPALSMAWPIRCTRTAPSKRNCRKACCASARSPNCALISSKTHGTDHQIYTGLIRSWIRMLAAVFYCIYSSNVIYAKCTWIVSLCTT